MAQLGRWSQGTTYSDRLRTLRWLLPLILGSAVVVYEVVEAWISSVTYHEISHWWEVALFGLVGPLVVGLVLNWMAGQMQALEETEDHLQESLDQLRQADEEIRLANITLEQKVAARTESLLDAYQKVAEQNEALQTLDQLKSEFVSLVSHELRAPLTNINGGIELILTFGEDLDPDVFDSLQLMKQESSRLTRLVENILNVSVLEAGQLHLNLGPVALPSLIQHTVESHSIAAPEHHFEVEIQEDLPLALADETCMGDILYNLVDNAIKYTRQPAGGEIKVVAGCDTTNNDRAEIDTIWISVIDNGAGIAPEDQEKIFAPFHRLNGHENQEVYGYGLGLYFARKLMEAQGGEIRVESEPGQGSSFTVSVPAISWADSE